MGLDSPSLDSQKWMLWLTPPDTRLLEKPAVSSDHTIPAKVLRIRDHHQEVILI